MHLNSINQNFFHSNPRRNKNGWVYKVQVLSNPKATYQLKRSKSRLRVSFIGYSYNIKFK